MTVKNLIPSCELEKIGNLISYLITQRELAKPVSSLKRILRDLRLTILNIIITCYQPRSSADYFQFIEEVESYLAEFRDEIGDDECDVDYLDYCIEEILDSFSKVSKIKTANPSKNGELLNMLILRSFDFKLNKIIRIMNSSKRERLET